MQEQLTPKQLKTKTPVPAKFKASRLPRYFEQLLEMSIGLGANGRAADILATGWLVGEEIGLFERRNDYKFIYETTVQSKSITQSILLLERIRTNYLEADDPKTPTKAFWLGRELSKLSISDLRRLGRYLNEPDSVLPDEVVRFRILLAALSESLKSSSHVEGIADSLLSR